MAPENMTDGIDVGMDDQHIEQKLQRSLQLQDAIAKSLILDADNLVLADCYGIEIGTASICLSMEHGSSLLILMAHRNPNTATATLRMQFETMVRGAWAVYAATEQEIDLLERDFTAETDEKARKVGVYGKMLEALRGKDCMAHSGLVDEIGRIDQVLRHSFNSYVHGGFQPLTLRGKGFPLQLALRVIETSNAISTMAAAQLAVLIDDEGHRLTRLNSVIPAFRDVLPELIIVQERSTRDQAV